MSRYVEVYLVDGDIFVEMTENLPKFKNIKNCLRPEIQSKPPKF